jgi:sugar phosphate isomerase/epimerase
MDKPWNSFCTMSIVHFMAFPDAASGRGRIADTVMSIAEDDFFDAIEIAWIADDAERQKVREILEISQLQVGFCAHPIILDRKLNLNSLDEGKRRQAVDQMKRLLDQASELGASSFAFLSGRDPGEVDRKAALEALIDSVQQICTHSEERGIRPTLETFDRHVDKRALIGPVADAALVARAVRATHPGFGLLYDLSHMPILDETPEDMAVIAEYLAHIHVGNCVKVDGQPLYGDMHPYIGFPGSVNGVDELACFLRGLFDIGYLAEGKHPRPWVGFEVKPQGLFQTPELIVANAKRVWRQAWARV